MLAEALIEVSNHGSAPEAAVASLLVHPLGAAFRSRFRWMVGPVPYRENRPIRMMQWGLLSFDDAKKVYEKKLDKNLPGKLESADGDVEDVKTSTLSDRNLDVVPGIVSKTKRKKVRRNRLGDATSDLISRRNKKQKILNKHFLGDLRKNKRQKVST